MYNTAGEKYYAIFLYFISKYLVWLIFAGVIIVWWYFPELTQMLSQGVLFWGPLIVLIFGFLIAVTRTAFRAKKEAEQGIYQYEIIIKKSDFYIMDLIIYGGTMLILGAALLFDDKGVGPIDLIQALIYFIFCGSIRQMIYKKTCQ